MDKSSLGPLLVLVLAALGQSWLLAAIARRVALLTGVVDHPNVERKVHQQAMPLLGGVAMFLSFWLVILEARLLNIAWLLADTALLQQLPMLILSSTLFCVVGVWDDCYGMPPLHKFLWQIFASLPFALFGVRIDQVSGLGIEFDLGPFGILLTLLWLVACANFINLMDGLDGLAASICLVIAFTLSILASRASLTGLTGINLVLAGVLAGFLIHNWNPARIFMGDAGSLTLGFLVGASSLVWSVQTTTGFAWIPLVVLFSIPMFDTTMAIVRRKFSGRGIAEADQQHIHHCLVARGLTIRLSVLAIVGLCSIMGASVILADVIHSETLALEVGGGILLLLILGNVFGAYECKLFRKNLQTIGSRIRSWIG